MQQSIELVLLQIKHLKEEKKVLNKRIKARKELLKYMTNQLDDSILNPPGNG